MKIKMYFDGQTMEPAFGKPHVQRIDEVRRWMEMAAKVSEADCWQTASDALNDVLGTIPIEVDDAEEK